MRSTPPVQQALQILRWAATVVGVLLLTVYFGWAFDSRNMLQLGPEHRIRFEYEFRARHEDQTDWAAYLEIEERLAAEIIEKIADNDRPDSLVDRYSTGSLSNPDRFTGNWNRAGLVTGPTSRCVAVLGFAPRYRWKARPESRFGLRGSRGSRIRAPDWPVRCQSSAN